MRYGRRLVAWWSMLRGQLGTQDLLAIKCLSALRRTGHWADGVRWARVLGEHCADLRTSDGLCGYETMYGPWAYVPH